MNAMRIAVFAVMGLGLVQGSLDQGLIDNALDVADTQLKELADTLGYDDKAEYADYTNAAGKWKDLRDRTVWTSGMCAGLFWHLYDITGKSKWKKRAKFFTTELDGAEEEDDQDLGFQVYNSYGHGYRVLGKKSYRKKVEKAAETLDDLRWMEDVGAFYAWKEPSRRPEWERAVNIDMIMNIELLLQADIIRESRGKSKRYMAKSLSHADVTYRDLVRPGDKSTWHVADYTDYDDNETIYKGTYQGWKDDSTWSRGQAWAVYGFAMFYRLTGESRFLDYAEETLGYFMDNLPSDKVVYSDFDAEIDGKNCRDSSAGAIVASALLDLYNETGNSDFLDQAETLLEPLLSEEYLVDQDSDFESILMKGCREYDDDEVGTITGDYFFLEALSRYIQYTS